MNKRIKLIPKSFVNVYTFTLNKSEYETLLNYHVEFRNLNEYLKELHDEVLDCYVSCEKLNDVEIHIDADLDCENVRQDVEKSIGKYFKLALDYENG